MKLNSTAGGEQAGSGPCPSHSDDQASRFLSTGSSSDTNRPAHRLLSACFCRDYTTWREEGGRLPDGRHYKNFLLVDEKSGEEKLVITAEDSHRRDRRYNYKAVPEMVGSGWGCCTRLRAGWHGGWGSLVAALM